METINWIKISERRPDIGKVIICHNKCEEKDFQILILKHELDGKYYEVLHEEDSGYNNRGWYEEDHITHWAELPSNPNE